LAAQYLPRATAVADRRALLRRQDDGAHLPLAQLLVELRKDSREDAVHLFAGVGELLRQLVADLQLRRSRRVIGVGQDVGEVGEALQQLARRAEEVLPAAGRRQIDQP